MFQNKISGNISTQPSRLSGAGKTMGTGILAALSFVAGCEDRDVVINPEPVSTQQVESPDQTLAKISYKVSGIGSRVSNINVVLPRGKFRVSILEVENSNDEGEDSLKGAKVIFAKEYLPETDGTKINIASEFDGDRTIMLTSNSSGVFAVRNGRAISGADQ